MLVLHGAAVQLGQRKIHSLHATPQYVFQHAGLRGGCQQHRRDKDGPKEDMMTGEGGRGMYIYYARGTRIAADGTATDISKESIKLSVIETVTIDNHDYPSKWQVELPNTPAIIIESITKDSRNQLTIPYWEGRVNATGGFTGKGCAEITGD